MTTTLCAAAPHRDALLFITSRHQTTTNLSVPELQNIYLGRTTRWKDGHRIVVVVRSPATLAGRTFLQQVVRMFDIDFSQEWLGVVFRGEAAAPPEVIASAESVREVIAADPDAIAFVLQSELTADDARLLRTLTIEGKRSGEESYPFAVR
jgi:ABC-type phosphate transport system substrate-binding protein